MDSSLIEWFNSPYYSILYNKRDYNEAKYFIRNLINYLHIEKGGKILDLCCGKGRHAIHINDLGFEVLGIDIAFNNIRYAKKFSNKNLKFIRHDMREPIKDAKFDYVFNIFTSFGYFSDDKDDSRVINSIRFVLNENGKLIIDFLNTTHILRNLELESCVYKEGIVFHINRRIEENFIVKDIRFQDKGKSYIFKEKVKIILLEDFKRLLSKEKFVIKKIWGNYNLDNYEKYSPRMIILSEKSK